LIKNPSKVDFFCLVKKKIKKKEKNFKNPLQ
jgi:hypothetical protein